MKFCEKCGKELFDEAVLCPGCGCATEYQAVADSGERQKYLQQLSQKLNTNGIIWLVIGVLQIIGGLLVNWFLLIVGVLNIISAANDMKYSKEVVENPTKIVARFEPLTGPIITLVYNLVIGGVIGVVGSIYYFVGIRNFVMENKALFESFDR